MYWVILPNIFECWWCCSAWSWGSGFCCAFYVGSASSQFIRDFWCHSFSSWATLSSQFFWSCSSSCFLCSFMPLLMICCCRASNLSSSNFFSEMMFPKVSLLQILISFLICFSFFLKFVHFVALSGLGSSPPFSHLIHKLWLVKPESLKYEGFIFRAIENLDL